MARAEQHQQPRQQAELWHVAPAHFASPNAINSCDQCGGKIRGSGPYCEGCGEACKECGSMELRSRIEHGLCEDCQYLPACPNCGERGGRIIEYDFGRSSETGYHDAGEACTRCFQRVIDAAE